METRCADSDMLKEMSSGPGCKVKPLLKNNSKCPQESRKAKKDSKKSSCAPLKACGLVTLTGLFLLFLTGFVVYWCTDLVRDSIIQGLVIRNNTKAYAWWTQQPAQPHLQVHVFNYTNVERFLNGDDERLHLEEAGPYTYKETMERVNVVFHSNGTVSYQEKRSFEFVPNASVGSLDDRLVVPNVVLLSFASMMKDSNFFLKVSMSVFLRHLDVQPFLNLRVEDYFWGYDDPLFEAGKKMSSLGGMADDPNFTQKLGLLVKRNGTSPLRISIHSGAADVTRLGLFDRYGGKVKLDYWGSDECNRLDGTDGSMFPPHLVGEDAVLHMYISDMCRKFPFVFQEYVQSASGVPAMRFHPPRDVFATGESHPENSCYCHPHAESCPPAGVFNASPCSFNAPVMHSFPHFYLGDPILLDMVEGLKPDEAKHGMFLDIHPEFGFPVGGESRFQVNMMVRKSSGITSLTRFKDKTILPIAWFEVVVDSLHPEVAAALQTLAFITHSVKHIVLVLFLVTLLIGLAIAIQYRRTRCRNKKKLVIANDVWQQGAPMVEKTSSEPASFREAL